MIAILNYSSTTAQNIRTILAKNGLDSIITLSEMEICKAEKIILPDTESIEHALKKLRITNLLNLLKILKKPVLGILSGSMIMCDEIDQLVMQGIGLIHRKGNGVVNYNFSPNEIDTGNTPLLTGYDKQLFQVSKYCGFIEAGIGTGSRIYYDKIWYSMTIEEHNAYALFANDQNDYLVDTVVKNFGLRV
ncbi:MAG: hypothetical protein K9G57_00475 [Ignavibacteriales bacterium]|nr:hypothetical protein [Ignavibacteriales bacterium]